MNDSLKELKRIRQETCPATYMNDFDKEKSCNIIEKDLKALQTLRELLLIEVREIGGRYYIKYRNIEEDNYIDYEISKELYEVLHE